MKAGRSGGLGRSVVQTGCYCVHVSLCPLVHARTGTTMDFLFYKEKEGPLVSSCRNGIPLQNYIYGPGFKREQRSGI